MLSFRVDAAEAALIRYAAEQQGLTVSAYLRRSLRRAVRQPALMFSTGPSTAVGTTSTNYANSWT